MLLQISTILSENETEMSMFQKILDQFINHAIILGQRIVLCIILYFVGRWIISWIKKIFIRFLNRRQIEDTVKSFLASLIDITSKIILGLIIINTLGISTTSFAAILAAAGLAIGMSMKDNLSNFAGGVLLLINKPFKVGDRVFAQGMDGVVQSIGILYTIMLTADNRTIFIPNGPLSTGNIINYSRQAQRRIDITLNVNYGADIDLIRTTLSAIINSREKILSSPEPFIGVTLVNNGNLDITIRVWVNTQDYAAESTAINESVYKIFYERGIFTTSSLTVKIAEK